MQNLYHLAICGLSSILLWSCQNDPTDQACLPRTPADELSFVTQVEQSDTKGTPTTAVTQMTNQAIFCAATGLYEWNAFNASCNKMFNTQMNQTAGLWSYANGNVLWGAGSADDRFSFFAYSPVASATNGLVVNGSSTTKGIPTLTYTTPTDILQHMDLLVAEARYNLRPTLTPVRLNYKHALTCISFSAKGHGQRISSMTLKGVVQSGTLALDGRNTWSVNGSKVMNVGIRFKGNLTMTNTPQNMINDDGYAMLIPQSLSGVSLVMTFFDDLPEKTFPLNINPAWLPGQRINYLIDMSNTGGVVDRITLEGTGGNAKLVLTNKPNNAGLFFKFGSVVGLFSANGAIQQLPSMNNDTYSPNDVAFNPTGIANFPSYTNIPAYEVSDGMQGLRNVSSTTYHHAANIRLGKGDPCKLVGLTLAQIKSMSDVQLCNYQSGWRLPTPQEDQNFSGQSLGGSFNKHWWSATGSPYGTPPVAGGEFPIRNMGSTAKFFPAAGSRDETGICRNMTEIGYSWTNQALNNTSSYLFQFSSVNIYVHAYASVHTSANIRCVQNITSSTRRAYTIIREQ